MLILFIFIDAFEIFHDWSKDNALKIIIELRQPLPITTFEVLLLQLWHVIAEV